MNAPSPDIYEFDNFRVDAVKRLLTKRGGEVVPLAPKAFETLLYLVRHPGKLLEKEELMREIWVDTIVEENNLNQSISAVRRVLGERHDEHRFIVTVPGRGYKFVAEVRRIEEGERGRKGEREIKNEVVMSELSASSSALDLSEEGSAVADGLNAAELQISDFKLQTENQSEIENLKSEINQDQIRNPQSAIQNRKWLVALVIFSLLGFSSFGFYLWRKNIKPADSPIKTIAVLPFKPLVADYRDEVLEIGMADTLIARLGNNREIVVRPISSVRKFGNLEQDAVSAGRALDVEAVLDGSIQRWGDKIRVNVRLIKIADGTTLWTGTFDELFADIFVVQDAISNKVVAALDLRLGGDEKMLLTKRYTENVEAYQLYLRGRFHVFKVTPPEIQQGISYFQQAIEIDPNYTLAYVGLADAYRSLAVGSEMPPTEFLPKSQAAANKAIELDDALSEGHTALGLTLFWEWNWKEAENQFKRALELNPNEVNAHLFYAHLLSNTGHHAKALAEVKLARELDPLFPFAGALEGQFLLHAGQTDAALDRLQKTFELNPNFWMPRLFASSAYIEKGMYAEAVVEAHKATELSPAQTISIAFESYALAKAGRRDEAQAALDELLKLSTGRFVPPYQIALIYNGLGETDKSLEWLEKGYEQHDPKMAFLKVEPKWNNLRNEPRFIELMRRMNFE